MCSLLLRKTAILTIIILMRRVLGERVYNFKIYYAPINVNPVGGGGGGGGKGGGFDKF